MLQKILSQGVGIFGLCLALLIPTGALAWGRVGHQVISLIAEQELTPNTLVRVREILAGQSLVEAGLWPDRVRYTQEWEHSKKYHFTQVPDGAHYWDVLADMTREEKADGDAVRALVRAEDILRSQSESRQDQFYALNFLVHLVGDIHQPLHTGRPQDLGGNTLRLRWMERDTNVHSIVDTNIIQYKLQHTPFRFKDDQSSKVDDLQEARLYLAMLSNPSRDQLRKWKGGTFVDWHDESQQLREQAYLAMSMSEDFYVDLYLPIVDRRILIAGYRLAALLNAIFDKPGKMDRDALEMRRTMHRALGKGHEADIKLHPNISKRSTHKREHMLNPFDCSHSH